VPILTHRIVGLETAPAASAPKVDGDDDLSVVDPLHQLLTGDLDRINPDGADCMALWPILPGLTDGAELMSEGLDRFAAAGLSVVLPVAPRVEPASARLLTECYGEELFAKLFHSGPVDLRPALQAVVRKGLSFVPPRRESGARAFERRVAAEFAAIAELLLIHGESPAQAQEFFRVAAWLEETQHDVRAMAREGNLGLVPPLAPALRPLVEELAAGATRSVTLERLIARLAS
jgi:hypothetical protein